MAKFKRAVRTEAASERRGRVVVKIILQAIGKVEGFPVPGSRKELIILEDATVGEVYDTIQAALFDGDEEPE